MSRFWFKIIINWTISTNKKQRFLNNKLNLSLHKLMNGYFNGSFKSMVSFFVKENNMDVAELESILKEVNKVKE